MEFRHMTKYFPHGFSDLVKVINQKKLKVLGNSSFIDVFKKKSKCETNWSCKDASDKVFKKNKKSLILFFFDKFKKWNMSQAHLSKALAMNT